jgi:hypothetical protein
MKLKDFYGGGNVKWKVKNVIGASKSEKQCVRIQLRLNF